jgi:acetyl-CoA acetyltransferase
MGIGRIPIFNVENACASGATAFNLAYQAILAGQADCVLAVGAEKMFVEDKARMFSLFNGGWDVSEAEATARNLKALGDGVDIPSGSTSEKPYSVFMDIYAALCRHHMKSFGTTQEQVAAVSAKNHNHSQHNPLAQYRQPFTIEQILAAPPIVYPLTLPMCSPMSDGAAAAILVRKSAARALGVAKDRTVRILASVIGSGSDRAPEAAREHITARLARRAWEAAGIGPSDVSVAEVHDATAFGEVIQSENLGFFDFGDGGAAALRGDTAIGGRIPINPSGGLESRGHPIGATGLCQVHELVTQLRGEAGGRQVEGALIAVAENGGGTIGYEEAAAGITILAR